MDGCGLNEVEPTPNPAGKSLDATRQRCLAELKDKREEAVAASSIPSTAQSLAEIFRRIDPACPAVREELYHDVLGRGGDDPVLLVGLAEALYSGQVLRLDDDFQSWRLEAWKDEIRDRILYVAGRYGNRLRAGKITRYEYDTAIGHFLDFSRRRIDLASRELSVTGFPNIHPANVQIDDLELFTHSIQSVFLYYARYADHPILGNFRNLEMMRGSLASLLRRPGRDCELIRAIGANGIRVLVLDDTYAIQSGHEGGAPADDATRTTSPSFLRDPKSGRYREDILILTPFDPSVPDQLWPGGRAYLLKPLPAADGRVWSIEAKVGNPRRADEDPRLRVLKLLGKVQDVEPPGVVHAKLGSPTSYRMVGHLEKETLLGAAASCGGTIPGAIEAP